MRGKRLEILRAADLARTPTGASNHARGVAHVLGLERRNLDLSARLPYA